MGKSINQAEQNPNWKGGLRKRGKYIYLRMPDHPDCDCMGYVAQHRIVVEKSMNRLLRQDEFIHHKNENTHDNRIENLQILSRAEHTSIHAKKRWEVAKYRNRMSGKQSVWYGRKHTKETKLKISKSQKLRLKKS